MNQFYIFEETGDEVILMKDKNDRRVRIP